MTDFHYLPQKPNALLQALEPQLKILENVYKVADISSQPKAIAENVLKPILPLVEELQLSVSTRFNMLDFSERHNLQIKHEGNLRSAVNDIEIVSSHSELETVCTATEHTIRKFLKDLGGNSKAAGEKFFQYFSAQPSPSETRFLAYSSLLLSIISLFK